MKKDDQETIKFKPEDILFENSKVLIKATRNVKINGNISDFISAVKQCVEQKRKDHIKSAERMLAHAEKAIKHDAGKKIKTYDMKRVKYFKKSAKLRKKEMQAMKYVVHVVISTTHTGNKNDELFVEFCESKNGVAYIRSSPPYLPIPNYQMIGDDD